MDNIDIGQILASILVGGICLITLKNFFSKWIKGIKSKKIAVNIIMKFKKDIFSKNVGGIAPFLILLWFHYNNAKTDYIYGLSDIEINSFRDFILSRDPFMKALYIIMILFIFVAILNVIVSMLFKVGIFENGIVVDDGTFIPWSSIRKLESENSMSDKYKVLVIYTNKTEKRKIFKILHRVKVRADEFEKAVDIMKNKMKLT